MNNIVYKILLTTSGTGSRLKELTKSTNKALVPINGRPTIEYIFDSYPEDAHFVITLGYLGDQVREYLLQNHPDKNFEFVNVDPFEGDGSCLLYSMKCAKDALQCPFIFHACDTIIVEPVPEPTEDWVAGFVVEPSGIDISQYRSHEVKDNYVVKVQDKGAEKFHSIHIGMTGIKDYDRFWQTVDELYNSDPNNQALGDVPVIEKMIEKGTKWKWVPFKTWLDTGNLEAIKSTDIYFKSR
ncbi:MAG: hypothetical protein V4438_02970 [Patescibacteria group bacterium]